MSEWRDVPGYEGLYEVSDAGEVRSFHRGWLGRPLAPKTDAWGYLRVTLSDVDGVARGFSAHELVAAAFLGPRPEGLLVRHLDGDSSHNAPSNLAYGTTVENAADMVRHGRSLRGVRSPRAKLSEAAVHEIRKGYQPGRTRMTDLAAAHGVTRLAVRKVLTGRAWAHLVTPGWSPIEGDMRTERHSKVTYGLAGTGREQ